MQLVAAGQTLYFTWFNLGKAFPYISLPHLFSNKLQLNVNKYPLYIKVEAKITEHQAPTTNNAIKWISEEIYQTTIHFLSLEASLFLSATLLSLFGACDCCVGVMFILFLLLLQLTRISLLFFVALMLFMLSIFGVVTLHWHLFI